jgi:carboxyl-terminal processing protease
MKILKFKRVFVWLVIIAMVLSTLSIAFAAEVEAPVEKTEEELYEEDLEFMKMVVDFIKDNYLYGLTYDEIVEGMYKGVFGELDKYSEYYSPKEFSSFREGLSGEFTGVGIQIERVGDYISVVTPLKGSPAAEAGIKAKDKIISVDGEDIVGYTTGEAAELIKGEIGTSVRLGILRNGEELYFNIIRDVITISSVNTEMIDDDIGYMEITQFNDNTLELFGKEIGAFDRDGVHKLVIDLRNNPGGSLDTVIEMLTFFIPEGPLAYIEDAEGETKEYTSSLTKQTFDIAVLVNEGSASASEIFAGAVQDRDAGTVIGTTTYGKGTVQSLYPLRNGSGIKLTTAEYFTAGKNKVEGIGITPDIIIEDTFEEKDIDISHIPELDKYRKPEVGIVGLDVLAAEMILDLLDYDVTGPDGIFDETLERELKEYQEDKGLYSYGVLDYTTQESLTQSLEEFMKVDNVDETLAKAVEILDN